jgi:PAS domain S-box-containing protein
LIALESENTMMAMLVLDNEGKIVYYNNRNYTAFPYFENELDWFLESHRTVLALAGFDALSASYIDDAIQHQTFQIKKDIMIDGRNPFFIDSFPIYQHQHHYHCFVFQHNPTQQELGLQLGIQERKFTRIIDNFQLGLLEVDNGGIILNANPSFCKMSGYSLGELIGKDAGDLLLNDENREMMRQINHKRSQGYTDAYELCVRNKKGEKRWWLISGAPNIDEYGQDNGSIGIHWDITLQKELEFSLQTDKQKAEALAEFKSHFLANMSHEIRTPLNAIVGMIRELKTLPNTQQQTDYLHIADIASESLLNIINDVLDFSKLEAGKVSLEQMIFSPELVMKNTALLIADRIKEKQLDFHLEASQSVGLSLIGDPNRLQQCLLNILSNAAKFTHVGNIQMGFEIIEEDEERCLVEFTIADTGVGMDPDFMNRVFEKFSQADETVTRKYGGSGLGLSITKSFVEMMGGSVQMESKKHVGTKVHLNIPFKKAQSNQQQIAEPKLDEIIQVNGMRVLVVEDNALNRAVAKAFLTRHKIQVTEAFDGLEALSIVDRQKFDLIFMDIQMPGIDGIEVCSLMREKGIQTPIIALTANALLSEKVKCEKAGMNDYLIKPFQERQILQVIANNTPSQNQPNEDISMDAPPEENKPSFSLGRIKDLVGDEIEVVNSIVQLFVREGSRIANEVEKAIHENDIAMIRARLHELRPNLHNMGMEKAMGYLENFRAHIIDDQMVGNAPNIGLNMVKEMRIAIQEMVQYLQNF